MRFNKYIFLILVSLTAVLDCVAQNFPVQANLSISPPYSVYLQDYIAPGVDKLNLNILPTDFNITELRVKFRISIEGQGVTLRTKQSFQPTPIFINGGVPQRFTGYDLSEYFNPENLDFQGISKQQFLQNGALPEGVYRFNIELLEFNRNVVISNKAFVAAWIILNDPPLVNLPFQGEKVRATNPQNVIFQWTPRHTGSPNSAFATEYEFSLVEIWPAGRNPEIAMRSSLPIFQTTTQSTTLVYGIAEPALMPGRSYAFRIRAKSIVGIDELDLFKNDGYSQTGTFTFGDECKTPAGFESNMVSPKSFNTNWNTAFNHTGFNVRYRESSARTNPWFEEETYLGEQRIGALKPETAYEVQVRASCGSLESPYSASLAITTSEEEQVAFSCGLPPDTFGLDNREPLQHLLIGEYIYANDFDIKINEITGSNGVFSGNGVAELPIFSLAKVRVNFEGISVNNEYRLVDGVITTIYNPNSNMMVDLDPEDTMEEGDATGESDSTQTDNVFAGTEITIQEPVDSVYVAENGDIVAVLAGGGTQTITPEVNEDGEKKDTEITDSDGNTWVVDSEGNVTPTGPNGGASDPSVIDANTPVDYYVTFTQSDNSKYGFDIKEYDQLSADYSKTTILEEDYWVAWKSIATNDVDFINAGTNKDEFPQSIGFKNSSGNLAAQVTGADQKQLTLIGASNPGKSSIQAFVLKETNEESTEEIIVGELNLASYNKIFNKVVLVPVNNPGVTLTGVETELNEIYGQAVSKWDVDVASNYSVDASVIETLDEGESGILSSFPPNMRSFNRDFKNSTSFDKDAYYLFVVRGVDTDRQGFMPFKRQFGYIYVDNVQNLTKTIAHELGHGAFHLKHPNSQFGISPTDNLMYSASGTKLKKYQWDNVHDPESVISWLQDDDEASLDLCYWWESLLDSRWPDDIDKEFNAKKTLYDHVREQYDTYYQSSQDDNVEVSGHEEWTVRKFSHSVTDKGKFRLVESLFTKLIQSLPPEMSLHEKGIFLGKYTVEGNEYDLSIFSQKQNLAIQKTVVEELCELVDDETVKVVVENEFVLISFFKEKKIQITIQINRGGEETAKIWLKHIGILVEEQSWIDEVKEYWDNIFNKNTGKDEYNFIVSDPNSLIRTNERPFSPKQPQEIIPLGEQIAVKETVLNEGNKEYVKVLAKSSGVMLSTSLANLSEVIKIKDRKFVMKESFTALTLPYSSNSTKVKYESGIEFTIDKKCGNYIKVKGEGSDIDGHWIPRSKASDLSCASGFCCQNCGKDLKITNASFNEIFPNVSKNISEYVNALNLVLQEEDFEYNTCERQAKIFAQVMIETSGLRATTEGAGKSWKLVGAGELLDYFKATKMAKIRWFNQEFWDDKDYKDFIHESYFEKIEDDEEILASNKYKSDNIKDYYGQYLGVNQNEYLAKIPTNFTANDEGDYKIFPKPSITKYLEIEKRIYNYAYGGHSGLGNGSHLTTNDGYNYRGRGAIQVTGKLSYINLNNNLKKSPYNFTGDIVSNPDLVASDPKLVIYSAFIHFKGQLQGDITKLDKYTIDEVSNLVNTGNITNVANHQSNRKSVFDVLINGHFKCDSNE